MLKKYFIPHKANNHKPYFFREISVSLIFVLVLFLSLFSAGATLIVTKTDFLSAIYPSVLVDLTNEARVKNNQPALKMNPVLEKAAKLKASDMAEKGYFAHTSPDGVSPWFWIGFQLF